MGEARAARDRETGLARGGGVGRPQTEAGNSRLPLRNPRDIEVLGQAVRTCSQLVKQVYLFASLQRETLRAATRGVSADSEAPRETLCGTHRDGLGGLGKEGGRP